MVKYRYEEYLEKRGPLDATHPLVGDEGHVCPSCHQTFQSGDYLVLLPVGPGDDEEERAKRRKGNAFTGAAIPVHWACMTGHTAETEKDIVWMA